jgi:AraC-like DNA-binding protein
MEMALVALQTSSINIAQAAYIAGYTSPANFATAFRKMFGITPSQARER